MWSCNWIRALSCCDAKHWHSEGTAFSWRTEAALLEAAVSVGLEGERISTPGMVLRLTGALAIEEEARSSEIALRLLSVMKRPGDIFGSPVETIRRIEAAAAPIGQQLVVNSAMVCDRLGVSRRTALALIGDMVEASCLVNVTSRRAARFWALPSLGSRIKTSPARPARRNVLRGTAAVRPVVLKETSKPGRLQEQFDERCLNRAFETLDAAMAGLDAVIRKSVDFHPEVTQGGCGRKVGLSRR